MTYDFITNGEEFTDIVPYQEGALVTSHQLGYSYRKNYVRKLDGEGVVEWMREFDHNFSGYFHVVPTTDNRIFVFGVRDSLFLPFPELHFCIMDSAANILAEKRVDFPFNITLCAFFQAADGGTVGIVNEVCNFSRVMRIDGNGDVKWFKSFIPNLGVGQPYGRSRINSIFHIGNDRYIAAGYQAFGYGTEYFRFDGNGDVIDDAFHDLAPGYEVMWESACDGGKTVSLFRSQANSDSIYVLTTDTALNVLDARVFDFNDSLTNTRDVIITKDDIILLVALDQWIPQPQGRLGVISIPQQGTGVNWSVNTTVHPNGSKHHWFATGYVKGGNRIMIADNYGPGYGVNGISPGNKYQFYLTELADWDGEGYCDVQFTQPYSATTSLVPLNYYMDTLPRTGYTEIAVQHDYDFETSEQPELLCEPDSILAGRVVQVETEYVKLFPNPASHQVRIEVAGIQLERVEVVDLVGRNLRTWTAFSGNYADLKVAGLPPGRYFVKVQSKSGRLKTLPLQILR